MTSRHIVKVKAPKSGSDRLELVLDPNWNVTPDVEDARDDYYNENPYLDLNQSSSQHSYHSESTAETDNRSYLEFSKTNSLESEGNSSLTDFERHVVRKMATRALGTWENRSMESIGEKAENDCMDGDENNEMVQRYVDDANREEDVTALQQMMSVETEMCENVQEMHKNIESESYDEDADIQYNVSNNECAINDVRNPDGEKVQDEQQTQSAMSGCFDDKDEQLKNAMSPRSEYQANRLIPRRLVSFDEKSLSELESIRSQDKSKKGLRRMPSEDTSVMSVGYRVVTTSKKEEMTSPPILRKPKYPSSASTKSSREKESTIQRSLSPTENSMARPSRVASVQSHKSNAAVGASVHPRRKIQGQEREGRQQRQYLQPVDLGKNPEPIGYFHHYDAVPTLTQSYSGLSKFSEGMRSTAALDGFREERPMKQKRSWFRTKKQISRPIATIVNEVVRSSSKTRLMKKFLGKYKKADVPVERCDSDVRFDDSDLEHEAPLPSILTSHRPMRVHTTERDWGNESIDQSIKSHNARQSVHDENLHTPNHSSHSTKKKNNPWANNKSKNGTPAASSQMMIYNDPSTVKADLSVPTNNIPDGEYNIEGAGMPSFKWWTWSQPNENGEEKKDSRYCAMMCVFPPEADE